MKLKLLKLKEKRLTKTVTQRMVEGNRPQGDQQDGSMTADWIEQGLTSHQTHYRSYWGQVYTGQMT